MAVPVPIGIRAIHKEQYRRAMKRTRLQNLERIHRMGAWKFSLFYGALCWGVGGLIANSLIRFRDWSAAEAFLRALCFAFTGCFVQLALWLFIEEQYKDELKKTQRQAAGSQHPGAKQAS